MGTLKSDANMQILKNIVRQNILRVGELKKIRDISLSIRKILENERDAEKKNEGGEITGSGDHEDDAVDEIAELTDTRGNIINKIKNIDSAAKHYKSQLPPQYLDILENTEKNAKFAFAAPDGGILPEWATNLQKLFSDQHDLLNNIKEIDASNEVMIKKLLGELDKRTKMIKNNRILMDKYNTAAEIHSGAMFKKQK